jgi:cytochrome P450
MSEALGSQPPTATAEAELDLDGLDLTGFELYRHGFPHSLFAQLRQQAPVWHHPASDPDNDIGGRPFWVLSRHDDVQTVSRDATRFGAIEGPALFDRSQMNGQMLTSMDGRPHTRQRKLISAGFTPRMIGRLEEKARGWAVRIIEEALERGKLDFVDRVAYPLPMHMIADIMGIPFEDRAWLFAKANDFLQCTDPEHPIPAEQQRAIQLEMFQYGQQLSAEKRRSPQDDIWTKLTEVEVEEDDGSRHGLEGLELDLFFILLTVAGSETTRNAITLGLVALLENRDELARLRADPGLLKSATEEILRWSSPVAYFKRLALCDTEIRGFPIREGDNVTIWYPSANRDEAVFEEPYRFDVARRDNPHVAFGGGGAHFCLGAHLARREISILFEELLARVDEIELLGAPEYSIQGIGNPIVMSPKALPVQLTPR